MTYKKKDFIYHEIAALPEAMTCWAQHNFRVSIQVCIACEGKHLDDIMLKTK